LTAREAARLASVLPNPRRFNPSRDSKFVENRSEKIYDIMVRRGIVIPEYEDVMSEPEKIEEEGMKKAEEQSQPDNKEITD
jgi:monofunctional biosynthetic peptidoglycan transglycosylase